MNISIHDWLKTNGYVDESKLDTVVLMVRCWAHRSGWDYVSLCFYRENDESWLVYARNHASGTHPKVNIGVAKSLGDVQFIHEAFLMLNEPEGRTYGTVQLECPQCDNKMDVVMIGREGMICTNCRGKIAVRMNERGIYEPQIVE